MINSALSVLVVALGAATAQPSFEQVSTAVTASAITSTLSVAIAQDGSAPAATSAAAQVVTGLPQREPPPRTLSAFWPVYVGFVVALFAIVGYFVRGVGSRHDRIARAVHELESPGAGG